MRYFKKISFKQFKKDIADNKILYENLQLPKRSTKNSAGYDFFSPIEFTLKSNDAKEVPLAMKVNMNPDEMLMIFVRSSMGFKYNVRMCNQVGIIEKDFYNNKTNEGHIYIRLHNHGNKDYVVKIGDKICQGIFVKFLTVDNEGTIENERNGGLGSTGQ